MATVLANPVWPVTGVEVDFTLGPPNFPSIARKSINAAYRRLMVRKFNTQRGRQYELDHCNAGTLQLDVVDPGELLNPDNPASPFNTGGNQVTPYRANWVWAMYPTQPGSGNIINPGVNNSYDASFEASLGLWAAAGGTTTLAQSAAQHFVGTKSMQVSQSAAGVGFGAVNTFRTAPGLTYTFSVYVMATAGCSVTMQIVDALGVTRSASTAAQNVWTRLSVTWNTVDTLEPVTVFGTGVTTPIFFVDATMLEFGASASAFTLTGPVLYPVITSYVERWPTSYDSAGFRALRPLEAVDGLAILAQTEINQSYEATIRADNPSVYMPFNNSKPATSGGALSTGSETAAITSSTVRGNPAYFVPSTGSISWAGDSQPDGTAAVVFSQQNEFTPPAPGGGQQGTVMDIYGALTADTVGGFTVEFWARPVVGQAVVGGLYSAAPGLNTSYPTFTVELVVQGQTSSGLVYVYNESAASQFGHVLGAPGGPQFPDNKWHYFANTIKAGSWKLMLDTTESGSVTVTSVGNIGWNYLSHVTADTVFGDPQAQLAYGRWAFYPSDITFARRLAHYQRGIGYFGEISGARVTRLLSQYWLGSTDVAAGFLAMASDFTYDPPPTTVGAAKSTARMVLDVLQEIQDSERGLVYVSNDGFVTFEDRSSRYLNQTALQVFGEFELPYEDYRTDHDPTYVFSQANLTRPDNTDFAPIINAATQTKYGQRILPQEVQCTTDFDLTQAGVYYTNRYAAPKTRITHLTLNPAANPALWAPALSLEISQRVTVKRRSGSLTTSNDYYVEQINHKVDVEAGEWVIELQLSPVFVPTAWVLGDATYGVLGTTSVPIY